MSPGQITRDDAITAKLFISAGYLLLPFAIGMVREVCSKAILIHAEVLIASDILTLSTRFCAGY